MKKTRQGLCWAICFIALVSEVAVSAEQQPQLRLELALDKSALQGQLQGRMTIEGWHPAGERRCLYLPLNDPHYFQDPGHGYSPTRLEYGRQNRQLGRLLLKQSGKPAMSGLVVQLASGEGQKLEFEVQMPRWPGRNYQRWLFTDFHPQPLRRCPKSGERVTAALLYHQLVTQAMIRYHTDLELVAPGLMKHSQPGVWQGRFVGAKFSFAVGKMFLKQRFVIGDQTITAVYLSPSFERLLGFIQPFFRRAVEIMGPQPYKHILVLETDTLEKSMIPGVLTFNKESHVAADNKQQLVNWNVWQLANFIATQWFGAAIPAAQSRDLWLQKGLADMVALLILQGSHQGAEEFFVAASGKKPLFDFNYLQAQDLIAGGLTFLQPFNALVRDANGRVASVAEQHGFGYIRHSLALRSLYQQLGSKAFSHWLRQVIVQNRFQVLDPPGFLEQLRGQESAGQRVADHLRQWWSQDSWPDFELQEVETRLHKSGHYQTQVIASQSEDYNLPVTIRIEDSYGQSYEALAHKQKQGWIADFSTPHPVVNVDVNPDRLIYDSNRFNNDNRGPQLEVFPGSARTFKDNAYTLLWLPLVSKSPGEDFSFLMTAQLLRYLKSGYTSMVSYVPSEKRWGVQGFFFTDIPRLGLFTVGRLAQDYKKRYKDQRVFEVGLYRSPFLIKDPVIEVGVRLNHKEDFNHPDADHQSATLRFKATPFERGRCFYELRSDLERSLNTAGQDFTYQRGLLLSRGHCKFWQMDWGLRLFAGKVTKLGSPPESIYFNPQESEEARLRYDISDLDNAPELRSIGFDLLWPARLPLPETMFLLPKQSRYRFFADYGETVNPDQSIENAGLGFLLPLGGDAVGKNSISVLQFSVLVVLHRKLNGSVNNDPGVLIDFLGKI